MYGQQKKFDSIFYNTAVNISSRDTNKALHIADSLYQNTPEEKNKMRALMLSADVYTKSGKINKGIDYALKANLIAEESDDYEWVARISGFLSTQYRSTGLKSSGLRFLSKGMNASQKITNTNTSFLFQALAYQEKAYYQMEDKQFLKAVESLNKAGAFFKKLKEDQTKFFMLATNEEMLGKNNLFASRLDVAQTHYSEGLVYLQKASGDDSALKGFIYDGLGKVYFKQKEYDKAHDYFLKAVAIAEKADFLNLKKEVYQDLSSYYDLTKDMSKYKQYNNLYNEIVQNQMKENKQSADKIVTSINKEAMDSSNSEKMYLYVAAGIIAFLIFFFVLYGIRKKKEKEKFQNIVKVLRERSLLSNSPAISNIDSVNKTANPIERQTVAMMSVEVEQMLLEKLRKFELGNKFTDNTISLSSLSTLLDTNSKYLSYVINNHKGKDFNTYINELRIYFIINKIENDSLYAQYKISYLAEESGFSSHSKFSAVFKSVVGLSPSVFLEQHMAAKSEESVSI